MKRPRVGVIGLGMAVGPHAQSLRDLEGRVEVAGAFSPSPERRDAFAKNTGFPVCATADELFDDPTIDGLLLLTPPNTHLDLVSRAAAKGKHILLEKPLEITFERSKLLVAAAEKAKVKLAICLQHRFRPVAVAMTELMRDERLGTLVSASARLSNWRPQSYYDQPGRGAKNRDGGGVLLTQAIHTLDLLISLVGLPDEVMAYAATSPIHKMETEDLAMGAMRFANGALGVISATTCAYPGFPDAIDLIGTKGSARLDGARLQIALQDGTTTSVVDDDGVGGAGANPMAFSHHHHRGVIADFLDAIETGKDPRITGREALKAHRLIEAILASARSGKSCQVKRFAAL